MVGNQLFIPLRGVFEELNFNVVWNGTDKTITIKSTEGKEIKLQVGSRKVYVSGNSTNLQNPPH
ncbi:MAG TPA: hypothetical protein DEA47_04975 [Peptococcaceae bacterium]|nr:hypothetical protein [Peptococcaceae bacterium]